MSWPGWRTALDLLLAMPVAGVGLALWLLPWRLATALARGLATLAWWWWPTARRVAMINLRRAYGPSLSRCAARERARQALRSLALGLAEGVLVARTLRRRAHSGAAASLGDDLYRVEDPELLARILADPRAKVLVTAHLGSWEAMAVMLGRRFGDRGAAVVRPVDNPFVDALLSFARVQAPGQLIAKRGAVAVARERLAQGDSIALLVDENAGPAGPFVPFFGRLASTRKTAAVLALEAAVPVVAAVLVRASEQAPTAGPPFLLRLAAFEPADYRATADPVARDPVRSLTADLTAALEGWIRDAPEQWRWIHWRWKHRPDGTVERYGRCELAACFAAASALAPAAPAGPNGRSPDLPEAAR